MLAHDVYFVVGYIFSKAHLYHMCFAQTAGATMTKYGDCELYLYMNTQNSKNENEKTTVVPKVVFNFEVVGGHRNKTIQK